MLNDYFCNAILILCGVVVYFEFKPSLFEVLAHLNYCFASTPLNLLNFDLNLWRCVFLDLFMFKIIWVLFFWFLILLYFFSLKLIKKKIYSDADMAFIIIILVAISTLIVPTKHTLPQR